MALVLDTGPVLALLDRDDPWHTACRALADAEPGPLVVPAPCLVEIEYWVRKRLQPAVWVAFAVDVERGGWLLHDLDGPLLVRAAALTQKYASLDLGFVDAAVIAVCEARGERRVATLDRRHFSVVRPRHCAALQLVPEAGR